MPPPVHTNFVVFPPGCGDSVADFWGWGTLKARLCCPSDVSGDLYMKMRYQDGPLSLNLLTTWPWSPWGSSPTRKNSHGRAGNRTRDFMISSQKPWPLDLIQNIMTLILHIKCLIFLYCCFNRLRPYDWKLWSFPHFFWCCSEKNVVTPGIRLPDYDSQLVNSCTRTFTVVSRKYFISYGIRYIPEFILWNYFVWNITIYIKICS